MALNVVVLEGRLTRDPEIKTVGTTQLARFTMAVSRKYKDTEEVLFMNVAAWGNLHLFCIDLKKGERVLVAGKLKESSWEKDGVKQSRIEVVADQVVPLNNKKKDTEEAFSPKESIREADPVSGQGSFSFDLPF